jgi:N-acetylmuramoyl-L-alanine amidase
VQISASNTAIPTDSDFFETYDNIEEYKTENGYKYLVGKSDSYMDIVEYSKSVRNKFPDAFIIAFKNGEIIPLIKAIKELSN